MTITTFNIAGVIIAIGFIALRFYRKHQPPMPPNEAASATARKEEEA